MNSLHLSPISGTSAAAAGSGPAGEAVSSPSAKAANTSGPKANAAQAAQAKRATAASQVGAEQTAAAEHARAAERIATPALDLSVGLVGGTFDVYVDLTDRASNRRIARLYGPRGNSAPAPHHTAPAKVRTEA